MNLHPASPEMQGLLKNWLLWWVGAGATRAEAKEARRRTTKVIFDPILLHPLLPNVCWGIFILYAGMSRAEFKNGTASLGLNLSRPARKQKFKLWSHTHSCSLLQYTQGGNSFSNSGQTWSLEEVHWCSHVYPNVCVAAGSSSSATKSASQGAGWMVCDAILHVVRSIRRHETCTSDSLLIRAH